MERIRRFWLHLRFGPWLLRRRFSAAVLDTLTRQIAEGERRHLGEVRLVLEGRLGLAALWQGHTARHRAAELFSTLKVWDTQGNTGVLIYVLMAERRIEILADRGISGKVDAERWQRICALIREAFQQGLWQRGLEVGIGEVHAELARYYPSAGHANPDELPDRPLLL